MKNWYENCQDTNLCILQCLGYGVCIRTCECSCVNNVVYLNICKHIYKIAEKNKIDQVIRSLKAMERK